MVERRSGEDRRYEDPSLATQKQTVVTGGNVNYYLTALKDESNTVVEIDDMNKVLLLSFAQGTVLKSVNRLCKLRQGLGKPGSNPHYEAGKVSYYNTETAELSVEREEMVDFIGKCVRWGRDLFAANHFSHITDVVIDVPRPRRLKPYSFRIGDFIDALEPSKYERIVLENLFQVAHMRLMLGPPHKQELKAALAGKEAGKLLQSHVNNGTNI